MGDGVSARWMSDRVFFTVCALIAAGLIALATVWPQGLGARSPGPLARPLAQPAPAPAPPPGTPAPAAPPAQAPAS